MHYVMFRTCLAVLCGLVLIATGLGASPAGEEAPAAAMEKEMVLDPATGEMVSAPEYGGTLTYATGGAAPANADTHFLHVQAMVTGATTEKLGIMDWAIDRDVFSFRNTYIPLSVYRPHLAESWDTPDPLTIIFNIRKGVNWHDKAPMNGREFTADDVVFNFHRLLGLGEFAEAGPSPFTYQRPAAESVTATDRYTVVIKLPEPSSAALGQYLGIGLTYMNAPEVIQEHGDVKDWRNLVGTGPYLLTDWTEGSSFTFQKNPDYWKDDEKYPGNRLPYIDEIQGLIILEEATYLAGLRTGKIDFLGFPVGVSDIASVEVLDSLQKSNPEIVLQAWWDRSENSYAIDASKPPFDDVRVRRAMQMAIDLEGIDRSVYQGTSAWQPQGIIGEGVSGYFTPFEEWQEAVKSGYRYDPAGAEALLDEAGYPRGADGTRFKTVLNHLYRFPLGFSELAATYWADIGVDVEINVLDEAGASPARRDRTWEGLIYHTMGNNTEPLGLYARWYTRAATKTCTESGTPSWTPCSTPLRPLIPKRNGRGWSKRWICTPWRTTGGYGVPKLESTCRTSHGLSDSTVKPGLDSWTASPSSRASGLTVS